MCLISFWYQAFKHGESNDKAMQGWGKDPFVSAQAVCAFCTYCSVQHKNDGCYYLYFATEES